jgi:UDP-N-acetyl-D-glucosamine dehydrogenase
LSIGIVGLGYVGLPLAVSFAEAGEQVIGVDVDHARVAALSRGSSPIEDITDDHLHAVLGSCRFTNRAVELHETEAILVCVPTPLTRNREPDLGPLLSAARALSDVVRRDQVIVLESTTFPGTTREHLVPLLEESGLQAGEDFALAFSPERVDPGRTDYTIRTTPKVVGGLTPRCTDRAAAIYARICDHVVPVSTPEVAELSKLLENIYRSVNIALVNELARLADRMDIDIWEVIDAAATKPFGFTRFDPGPGMGGHCLPVDPFYLSWKAREYDLSAEFIELAGKVNQSQPYFCVEKAERALNDAGKPVRGSRILILGVSYKAGVGDTRESPALRIIELLQARGGDVVYHDPHVPELAEYGLRNVPLDQALEGVDLAVIVTAHPSVDHGRVVERAPLMLDLRGTTRHLGVPQL